MLTPTEADTVKYPKTTEHFSLGENTALSHLLPQINSKYGVNLQPEDFWDTTLPTFEGLPPYDDKYVKLEAKPDSKIYIGGVLIKIDPNDYDLANMPVTTLGGLIYPTWQVRAVNFVNSVMDRGAGNAFWFMADPAMYGWRWPRCRVLSIRWPGRSLVYGMSRCG
jgi:hypothetical protein